MYYFLIKDTIIYQIYERKYIFSKKVQDFNPLRRILHKITVSVEN